MAQHHVAKMLGRVLLIAVSAMVVQGAGAMDLRQAYEAALQNDASIRASRAAAQAGQERLPQAKSQLLPNVSFSAGRNYNDLGSEAPGFLGQRVSNQTHYWSDNRALVVRQPLYRPYLTAQLDQARAQVRDVDATLERDEQGLVVRVGEAYFDALLAREQVKLVRAQKVATTAQLDAARKGFAAGSGTRTDIDDAQARLDMVLAQELEVQQNEAYTRERLLVVTGSTDEALADVNVPQFVASDPVPTQLDEWIARAQQSSPELQSLQAQLDAARLEVEKAKAGHLPTLDLVAQWNQTRSDSVTSVDTRYNQKAIGVQLSIPLYAGGYVSSTVRQALATSTRVAEQMEAMRRDLSVRVFREFRGVTEGVARIRALTQAVASSEQAVKSSRESFKAGVRTTLDVLNAEQQRTQALRDLAQARYLYLVSRLRLQSLAGEDRLANVADINRWLLP